MADLTDDAFHNAAWLLVQRDLLSSAQTTHRLAFRLGVTTAELDLGIPGLYDPRAQAFVEQFEFDAIRSLTAGTSNRLRETVLRAVREGLGAEAILRDVRRVVDAGEGRVRSIARTELNRAGNWGRFSGWRESGLVDEKEYVATLDDRVRPDHLEADGERVGLNEPFTRGAAAGFLVPPVAPNCRCAAAPVTRLTRRLGPSPTDEARAERRQELLDELEGRLAGYGLDRVLLVAQAVAREIPGLRAVEARHERDLLAAWRRWPQILAREWGAELSVVP